MDDPSVISAIISSKALISNALWAFVATVSIGFITVIASIWVAIHNTKASDRQKKSEFEASNELKRLEFLEMKKVNQTQIYWDWLDSLQDFMNDPSGVAVFKRFQKTSMKVIVQGEDTLASYMRDYYFSMIQFSHQFNNRLPISPLDHNEHQKKIINQMRIAQGMEDIGAVHLITFAPKDD